MRKAISVLGILALVGVASGCSDHKRVTTTTRETVEAQPVAPVVTETHTTHTETHTNH